MKPKPLHICCLVLGLIIAASTGWGFNPNTDPSLVGWWKLDDGAGTVAVDSSPGGHHGTLVNGPVWVQGYFGGALQFDGVDDYVDTGWNENIPNWTICAWVISPAAPASGSPSGPVHRENNYQINWNHSDANWQASIGVNVGGWYNAPFRPVEANTWYFIAGSYDGDTLRAYRNGELISENTSPSGPPSPDGNTLKFGRHAANAQYFGGTVDDVRVYNRALTDDEIREVMKGGGNLALASQPQPKSAGTDVPRDIELAWKPGIYPGTHDVYLGTGFDDVNNASRANPGSV
ncbi:MAG: LamG domain-containing protein, partial [Sedimentisphaerales bacterium]|nr:LamG domain-containing protein [Sedimentisphaerales bacterium]